MRQAQTGGDLSPSDGQPRKLQMRPVIFPVCVSNFGDSIVVRRLMLRNCCCCCVCGCDDDDVATTRNGNEVGRRAERVGA